MDYGPGYVQPPFPAGEDIAGRLQAGVNTLLLGGPAGVGKSTELARAASLLRAKAGGRVACHIPIDRWENLRRMSADQMLLRIAGRVAFIAWENLKLRLSHEALAPLVEAGVLTESALQEPMTRRYGGSAAARASAVLNEVRRLAPQGKVTLLIDGMEKVPEGPGSLELFDALSGLPDHVELVVVVPWHATFGPQSETVIRTGEHWCILHAPQVEGEEGAAGRRFLREVLARRLGMEPVVQDPAGSFAAVVDAAAELSGGIPRVFLQLVADAGTYARLRRKADWPTEADLADAIADAEESYRRALMPGDTEAITLAAGTDGRELELGRKVRLLSRGVLLERERGRQIRLEVHPLARKHFGSAFAHA